MAAMCGRTAVLKSLFLVTGSSPSFAASHPPAMGLHGREGPASNRLRLPTRGSAPLRLDVATRLGRVTGGLAVGRRRPGA